MIVTDIQEMEKIVNSSNTLSWDGWDVVCHVQKDDSEFLSTGSFNKQNGKWYSRTVYPCSANGWNIPNSVG
jgi:hypothetical protein